MANTSSRTLRLLSLLQTRRYWPGEELAEQLQVSPRTLRRDVDRLRELGYPIQAQRGVAGGYQLAAGAALPPLVVDDEEAVALALGLQAAAQGAVEGIAEASVRALAKVVQVMPARLRRRVQALGAMTVPASWEGSASATVDPGVLTAIALACRDTERIRFSYTAADGRQAGRHVEPHRLCCSAVAGTWPGTTWTATGGAATGWTGRRAARDRGQVPAARAARRLDAAAFVRAGIESARAGYDIEVLVEAPAAVVRERIGRWASVSEISADRCRVRMTADALEWPIMGLGMVGADFQVISPPELTDWVRDWGARFSRAAQPRSGRAPVAAAAARARPRPGSPWPRPRE